MARLDHGEARRRRRGHTQRWWASVTIERRYRGQLVGETYRTAVGTINHHGAVEAGERLARFLGHPDAEVVVTGVWS